MAWIRRHFQTELRYVSSPPYSADLILRQPLGEPAAHGRLHLDPFVPRLLHDDLLGELFVPRGRRSASHEFGKETFILK